MKKTPLPSLLLILTLSALHADPLKLEKLTLKNGREYQKVIVTEKRTDGISISHESGTARVNFELLPADVAENLGGGFAPEDPKVRQAKIDAEKSQVQRQVDIGNSHECLVKVVQVTDEGSLCNILFLSDTILSGGKFKSVLRDPKYSKFSVTPSLVLGLKGVTDGQTLSVRLVGRGTHKYTTVIGAGATVKKYEQLPMSIK